MISTIFLKSRVVSYKKIIASSKGLNLLKALAKYLQAVSQQCVPVRIPSSQASTQTVPVSQRTRGLISEGLFTMLPDSFQVPVYL